MDVLLAHPYILTHFSLDYQDSNLEKQDQNLLCYHYTIVQTFNRTTRSVFDDAKILHFINTPNFFRIFFFKPQFFVSFTFLFKSITLPHIQSPTKKNKNCIDFATIFSFIQ